MPLVGVVYRAGTTGPVRCASHAATPPKGQPPKGVGDIHEDSSRLGIHVYQRGLAWFRQPSKHIHYESNVDLRFWRAPGCHYPMDVPPGSHPPEKPKRCAPLW